MKDFGNELRAHREAKHLSLADLAHLTKISPKYLQAMEEGNFNFLPVPYVRAFIRDYAKTLELDPDDTLRRYEGMIRESVQGAVEEPEEKPVPVLPATEKEISTRRTGILRSLWLSTKELFSRGGKAQKFLPAAAVIVVLLAIVLIANITRKPRTAGTAEIPFEQVVREKEASLPDTMMKSNRMPATFALGDSLLLEGKTTYEVWMRIYIDNEPSKEYLFGPEKVQSWKAKEKFRVSLGNAGGISFTLNGKPLGTFGKSGEVVQNVLITREGVQR